MTAKEYYETYSVKFKNALNDGISILPIVRELHEEMEAEMNKEVVDFQMSGDEFLNLTHAYAEKWNKLVRMFKKKQNWSPITPMGEHWWFLN